MAVKSSSDMIGIGQMGGCSWHSTPFSLPVEMAGGFSRHAVLRYNAPMRVISLQSGSNGNCIYVEADGVKLLFDAGISGIQVKERLALHGRDMADVDAVLISHDHVDHSRSMGVLNRKFGLPIYATAEDVRGGQPIQAGRDQRPSAIRFRGDAALRQGRG